MNWRFRKILYLLLGSGAFITGLLAVVGLIATVGASVDRWAEMDIAGVAGMTLAFFVFAGGLWGIAAAMQTLRRLPNVTQRQRVLLSCGLVAGILPCAGFSLASLGDSDAAANFYLLTLPALVGCALLLELWLPYWRRSTDAVNTT